MARTAPVIDDASGAPSPGPSLPRWWAIQVRANHERAVASALRAHGIPEFLPLYSQRVRWSDRFRVIERPLFPGYIFSSFDTEHGLPVLDVPGVVHMLPNNLAPLPVAFEQVETIRRIIGSMLPLLPSAYCVGELVRVETGSLAGTTGVITRVKDKLRLVVSVEMFCRAISIELDAESVAACR